MIFFWVSITVCLISSPNYCKDLVIDEQVKTPAECFSTGQLYAAAWIRDNEDWEFTGNITCTTEKPKEETPT